MRHIWQIIKSLWRNKWGFRIASTYLLLLLALVLALPLLPLPYAPNFLDLQHPFLAPFTAKGMAAGHPLGTDGLGRDVMANLLFGARTAFLISLPVMLLATFIGVALGTTAGYFGDYAFRKPLHNVLRWALGFLAFLYYGLYLPLKLHQLNMGMKTLVMPIGLLLFTLLLLWLLTSVLLRRFLLWQRLVAIPIDKVVMRLIEALTSIPRFVLILVLASFIPPSLPLLSLLLIFTLWPAAARLSRAEMLRIKQLPYFEVARSIGNSPQQLIWRHALPNLGGPVLIAFSFGLGGLLALESTLSFLNIGVPTTLVSWGRTISSIRGNTSAWWLVAFPGGFLSLTVLALYTCSHYFSQIFGSRNGQ
ncbi:ABC transporter permease [Pontibacter anaerobius]|uniref:ABC transporter permease n=1 Tax=Pontibacter anaerobius TaxID=2993940 RepID=A0ABT3RGM3_9BACT|nr:ABC transporter permease [Pontibacter anaerobius]MCX2740772.1 ABC transporter permease [Pontibacter anaerobius]